MKSNEVPIWEKANLTIDEAANYFNIGEKKLYKMTDSENCTFVLWSGSRRLIKRKKLEEYLNKSYSI